ncbi:MAG: Crp/Fnr family transcriptional regulator [Candidatus Hydrogenedentes bacterium]|nr:Crp/Fnr family transcriptional regulator [Candidatus Hydrogenedentota bacterium]
MTQIGRKKQSTADPGQYEDMVSQIAMLQELDAAMRGLVCQILLSSTKAYTLAKGEVLYELGAEDENTGAILVKGAMKIDVEKGSSIRVRAPELLGEMQQLSESGQRTATVSATEESVVLEFAWHDFVYMVNGDPGLTEEQQTAVKDMLVKFAGARAVELAALGEDTLSEYTVGEDGSQESD